MEDLFRFVTLRPPQSTEGTPTLPLALDTQFQRTLAAIRKAPDSEGPPLPEALAVEARKFQSGVEPYTGRFVSDPAAMLPLCGQLLKLRNDLLTAPAEVNLAGLTAKVGETFATKDADIARVVNNEALRDQTARVYDSIIALFLAPAQLPNLLKPLTELAQTIGLTQRAVARDVRLASSAAIRTALASSLLLPPQIFPVIRDQLQSVGVADLLVVKQRLKQYELGDVATIENILRGETRRRTDKHTLIRDETLVSETETTTETTKELTTAERFELKQESEKTIKEDLSVKAGVAISAKYGAVQIDAKTDVAYSTAKSESVKQAQTTAKDVTQRAASKVTERVRRQLTTRVTETTEQTDERSLDNVKGTDNVSGVYQFVNKVYEAQVFNYGKRLLFDLMVPEPAAFLLDAVTVRSNAAAPQPPTAFGVDPEKISETPGNDHYYGKLAKTFAATGVPEPSLATRSKEQSFSGHADGDLDAKLELASPPEGYLAASATVLASFVIQNHDVGDENKDDHGMDILIGGKRTSINGTKPEDAEPKTLSFDPPLSSVGLEVHGFRVASYVVQVILHCVREPTAFPIWQHKVYAALQAAHAQQVKDYEEKLAALSIEESSVPALGSGNPERNREIERVELKKSVIALLLGKIEMDLGNFDAVDQDELPKPPELPYRFPRPASAEEVQRQGRVIRFFEQAFEWGQVTYVFYPYYWGRKSTWYDRLQRDCDDPVFGQFLRAGEARVVVPVRPGFEADIRYFLLTGQLWGGAELPNLTDATYLPITEEIKELSGASGKEVPQGDPWDVKLPTNLVRLRADGKLPRWQRTAPDSWTWQSVTKDDI
jgi:hypothetical protein